jgi:hypothetical protein
MNRCSQLPYSVIALSIVFKLKCTFKYCILVCNKCNNDIPSTQPFNYCSICTACFGLTRPSSGSHLNVERFNDTVGTHTMFRSLLTYITDPCVSFTFSYILLCVGFTFTYILLCVSFTFSYTLLCVGFTFSYILLCVSFIFSYILLRSARLSDYHVLRLLATTKCSRNFGGVSVLKLLKLCLKLIVRKKLKLKLSAHLGCSSSYGSIVVRQSLDCGPLSVDTRGWLLLCVILWCTRKTIMRKDKSRHAFPQNGFVCGEGGIWVKTSWTESRRYQLVDTVLK